MDIAEAYPEPHAEWRPQVERKLTPLADWNRIGVVLLTDACGAPTHARPAAWRKVFNLKQHPSSIATRFTIIDFNMGQPPIIEVYAASQRLTLEAMTLMRRAPSRTCRWRRRRRSDRIHSSGWRHHYRSREEINLIAEKCSSWSSSRSTASFEGMIVRYTKGEAAYLSRPFPKYARRYSEYDHLGPREGMVACERRGRPRGPNEHRGLVIPEYTREAQRRAAEPARLSLGVGQCGAARPRC